MNITIPSVGFSVKLRFHLENWFIFHFTWYGWPNGVFQRNVYENGKLNHNNEAQRVWPSSASCNSFHFKCNIRSFLLASHSLTPSLSLSECHFLNECTHTVRRKKKRKKSTANFQAITWCKWGKEKQNDERTVVVQRIIRKSARTTTTTAAAAATTTKRKLNRHNGIHNIIAKSRLCCGTKCQQTSQIKK